MTAVGFVSRDRPATLRRAAESYIQNTQAHRRDVEFLVFDDSPDPAMRAAYVEQLLELKERYRVPLFYGGIDEKMRYAHALSQEAKLPLDVVEFCLLDPEGCGHSAGANRNALLLDTAGSMIFMADDDTVCRLGTPLDHRPGLKFLSNPVPEHLSAFASAAEAQQSVRFEDRDILAIQEALLGRGVDEILDRYTEEGVDIDGVSPWFAQRLLNPEGQIKVTWMGIVGDSGKTGSHYLFSLLGEARRNAVQDESHFRKAWRSRQILRAARQLSIGGDGGLFQSTAMGLDNRELLPPFSPVYRNEDGVFGALYLTCLRNDFVAYLPLALLHDPQPPRENLETRFGAGAGSIEFNSLLKENILRCALQDTATIAAKMEELGRALVERAQKPPDMFHAEQRSLLDDILGRKIASYEAILQAHHRQPRFWAQALSEYISELKGAKSAVQRAVPLEPRQGRSTEEAEDFTRRLMLRFGRLLSSWPQIVEASMRLSAKGVRLARPV